MVLVPEELALSELQQVSHTGPKYFAPTSLVGAFKGVKLTTLPYLHRVSIYVISFAIRQSTAFVSTTIRVNNQNDKITKYPGHVATQFHIRVIVNLITMGTPIYESARHKNVRDLKSGQIRMSRLC